MEEIWKDIKEYEGLYQVSNKGNIRSLDRIVSHNNRKGNRILKGRVLSCWYDKYNYARITLSKNGKVCKYLVHYIVASTFIPNPENKPYIDHIDTNPSNNSIENLRWVTQKENINNKLTIEKMSGVNNHSSKPVLQFSKEGELLKKWNCIMDIERELNICNSSISGVCKGKHKTAGDYKWCYYYKGIWLKKHIPQIKKVAI